MGTIDHLVENVQKAACLQMMHDWELKFKQESPVMITVDPEQINTSHTGATYGTLF